ncbi:MAG: C25 family cysteine peptidase [Planctomycetota bacterium]
MVALLVSLMLCAPPGEAFAEQSSADVAIRATEPADHASAEFAAGAAEPAAGAIQPSPDVLLVCPDPFLEPMQPWIKHRQAQGHQIAVIRPSASAEGIAQTICELARGGSVRYVLLVGDVAPWVLLNRPSRLPRVPTHYLHARVNVLWGSEPAIASDAPYGDLDGDNRPELCVGRLSADTPAQLTTIVAKILAYERSTDFGPWRRQVRCVAGVGEFGAVADAVIESSARALLCRNIPAEYNVGMTYGNWRSPYCPDPRQLRQATLASLNEGAWFWVYVGHGYHLALDRMRLPTGNYPILERNDLSQLRCAHGAPIALMLACYTGGLDATEDCLAEEMLRQPGGPVAVLAASRVAMPYAMSLFSTSLMRGLFERRPLTIGELVRDAKRELISEPAADDQQRTTLDAIASLLSPNAKLLGDERLEHVWMFNLFGDPLLRLRYPHPVRFDVLVGDMRVASATTQGSSPSRLTAGSSVRIRGTSPIEGVAWLELAAPRGQLRFRAPSRREAPTTVDEALEMQRTYLAANDPCWTSVYQQVPAGAFSIELAVPESARGAAQLRLFIEGEKDYAAGSTDVEIVSLPASHPATAARRVLSR